MSDPVPFVSKEATIDKGIEYEVKKIIMPQALKDPKAEFDPKIMYELPEKSSKIVDHYVNKIEGTYNVARAKKDTDNAIDLLYIAYNSTPQEEGTIRVSISKIMDKLIKSQQDSELAMKTAMITADNILGAIKDTFPDWLDIKEEADSEKIKKFVSGDLLKLTDKIKAKALSVRVALEAISETYDEIIKAIIDAASNSEKVLGVNLGKKAMIEKEINEANAERERLESLVKELQVEVAKFEKKAREFEKRAETAEERAFFMSIVQVGAQMVSASMPAIAMALGAAATGGTSIVAASTLNTVKQVLGGKDGGTKETVPDQDAIKKREDISIKTKEKNESDKKIRELKTSIKELESEKNTLTAAEGEGKSQSGTGTGSVSSVKIKELEGQIATKKENLVREEQNYQKLQESLEGFQASLTALDKNLGAMKKEQREDATSLRQMQMDMLEKVEAYEKEKRKQNSDLIKITVLMKGKRTEEETIQLTIKSLNLSISALKRTKEIIVEIAFFFKSFADFMDRTAEEVKLQMELINAAAAKETLGKRYLNNLIESTDKFFIKQTGEWNAVWFVSDEFNKNFADGWTKLNKLSGKYIPGEELPAYLQTASATLKAIVEEREEAAKAKIANLDEYRKQVLNSVAA